MYLLLTPLFFYVLTKRLKAFYSIYTNKTILRKQYWLVVEFFQTLLVIIIYFILLYVLYYYQPTNE